MAVQRIFTTITAVGVLCAASMAGLGRPAGAPRPAASAQGAAGRRRPRAAFVRRAVWGARARAGAARHPGDAGHDAPTRCWTPSGSRTTTRCCSTATRRHPARRRTRRWRRSSTAARGSSPCTPPRRRSPGARMQASGGGEFRGEIVQRDHPAMKGLQPFPDLGRKLRPGAAGAADRTVLMERADGRARGGDVGARAGQGTRLLHRATATTSARGATGIPEADRAGPHAGRWTRRRGRPGRPEDAARSRGSTASTCRTTSSAIRRRSISCR